MPIDFDVTVTAGSYAEITGLLAGFGITLMALLFDRPTREARQQAAGGLPELRLLAVPLIAILILINGAAAIMWGFIAGAQGGEIRTWAMAYLAGYISTLSVVVAVISIQIVVPLGLPAGSWLRRLFAATISLLALLGMMLATAILTAFQLGSDSVVSALRGSLPFLGTLTAGMALLVVAGVAIGARTTYQAKGINSPGSYFAFCGALTAAIALIAVVFGVIALSSTGVGLTRGGVAALSGLWGVLVGWGQIFLLD